MKKILLLSVFFGLNAFAANEVQFIDCRYPESESNEHVIISLTTPNLGTFFYTTGLDDQGESQDTGKLDLNRSTAATSVSEKKDFVDFVARWSTTTPEGETASVQFTFSMHKDIVSTTSKSFTAVLNTEIQDSASLRAGDELVCFSKLYPKQK